MSLSNYTGKEIIKALYLLVPDLKGAVVQDNTIESWDATSAQPTDEQIVQACAEVRYDTEVKSYQQQRKLEYPSVNEQLDSIYMKRVTNDHNQFFHPEIRRRCCRLAASETNPIDLVDFGCKAPFDIIYMFFAKLWQMDYKFDLSFQVPCHIVLYLK